MKRAESRRSRAGRRLVACLAALGGATSFAAAASLIHFRLAELPFAVESGEAVSGPRYVPATMAGGLALFDCDGDGDLDLFFANGAELPGLKKTVAKFSNRLFLNDGKGSFTDFTESSGLAGYGFDTGVAAGDYDNDGDKDLFLAGVHRNSLYRNDGRCHFTEVTRQAGLDRADRQYGPLWAVAAAFFDYDNDGRLDLFVANYLSWDPAKEPTCPGYCHPKYYAGLPNQLFRNNGDGTFTDVSEQSGIRAHVGKAMGVAIADYDRDGRLDIFVTNDKSYNFLFHNLGGRFEERALEAGVALAEHALEISGMGTDFRDFDNDGWPDIVLVALENETFPLFRNTGRGRFVETTHRSSLASLSRAMAGYGPGLFDFDNDGWKDLFVSRGHVQAPEMHRQFQIEQPNTVFRNLGDGRVAALTAEAGLTAAAPKRHRGVAFGDLNGDGRLDAVVSALGAPAEIWINDSPGQHHWLGVQLEGRTSNRDGIGATVRVVTKTATQFNHATASTGYASSSAGPVHFGLGEVDVADLVEIRWPSGRTQRLTSVAADQILHVKEP